MYERPDASTGLRQGELIFNVTSYRIIAAERKIEPTKFDYTVVITQDCDLARNWEERGRGDPSDLRQVLLVPAITVEQAIVHRSIKGFGPQKVFQNQNERYHFIQACNDAACTDVPFPDLIFDFRGVFSIDVNDVYELAASTEPVFERACRLIPPYRDHLQQRFASYISRVSLDTDYITPGK